jgi:hypothetical protein
MSMPAVRRLVVDGHLQHQLVSARLTGFQSQDRYRCSPVFAILIELDELVGHDETVDNVCGRVFIARTMVIYWLRVVDHFPLPLFGEIKVNTAPGACSGLWRRCGRRRWTSGGRLGFGEELSRWSSAFSDVSPSLWTVGSTFWPRVRRPRSSST